MTVIKSNTARLQQFANALNFHLKMLGELVPWMIWFDQNGSATMTNACLESFLTHTRLLIEFIAGRKDVKNVSNRTRNKRDLQPESFGLTHWHLSSPTIFDGYLKRIDEHLSHLSLERVNNPNAQIWPVELIANRLLTEYGTFADRLSAEGSEQLSQTIRAGVIEALILMTSPNPRFGTSTRKWPE
jgi:hypothetical protein